MDLALGFRLRVDQRGELVMTMNKQEREAFMDQLAAENAETLLDIEKRRSLRARGLEATPWSDGRPTPAPQPQRVAEQPPAPPPQPQVDVYSAKLTDELIADAIEKAFEEIATELVEQLQRRDAEIKLLHTEIETLKNRLTMAEAVAQGGITQLRARA